MRPSRPFLCAAVAVLATTLTAGPAAAAIKVQRGIVYGHAKVAAPEPGSAELLLDLYRPAKASQTPRPVVVLIHGGGFRGGTRGDGGIVRTAKAMAARGIVVASIDYRLLGTDPQPSRRVKPLLAGLPGGPPGRAIASAVDDTLTSIGYLRRNAGKLGIDGDRLGLAGSSAGAITAAHVAYVLDDYGIRKPKIRFVGDLWGGILISASAAGAAPTRAEAVQAGRDAYLYGFPLIDFLRIRRENTSVKAPDKRGNAPLNLFSHAPAFAQPRDRTVVAPNVDTLYSIAQVDLGKGPIVLSHPDMGKRYFVFELLDPYTNVVGYVGSRTTGSKAGRFALTWTGRRNAKPRRGVRTVRSRYRRLWVIGRTLASDTPADIKRARRLQKRYSLTPLDRLDDPPKPPSGRPGTPVKATNPTGLAFFNALGAALKANPPPARDRPLLRRLERFGIGPGLRPDGAGLPADVLDGLVEGYDAQSAELGATTRLQILQQAQASGGWYTPPANIGAYGTDYLFRAQIALVGIGANTPEEAVYPAALTDSDGNLLDATRRYRITFTKGQTPPADAFWSLTMYDLDGFLVPNPADRYAVGKFHPPLVTRADGSVVVAIQRDKPAESDVNWLPTPETGNFRLNLRIYEPGRSVLTGAWKPPPVEPVP